MSRTAGTIHVIDLEYLALREAVGAHLVEAPGGPVLIETGPASTIPALVRGLAAHGARPEDVRHVLVTHIHFDHAGAAGWLAKQGATIWVHEFGAPHLVDPTKLIASARRIYGDDLERLWGEPTPIPSEQVRPVRDGDVIEIEGLSLRAIETPGHARHHHAFALENQGGKRIGFTGDSAATGVASCPQFVSVPTPPPEFDLDAWVSSIERLERERFDRIHLTHFGRVDDPARHLASARSSVREHAAFVTSLLEQGFVRDAIVARYRAWFAHQAEAARLPREHWRFYVEGSLPAMNVDGITRYLMNRNRPKSGTSARPPSTSGSGEGK